MGVILWAALRHVEAINESVAYSLESLLATEGKPRTDNKARYEQFTADHQMTGYGHEYVGGICNVNMLMTSYFQQHVSDYLEASKQGQWAAHDLPDLGKERSGSGWDALENFVLTSAFLRVFGAHEQFELDVLKALFYYRPSGLLGGHAESEVTEVGEEVLLEEAEDNAGPDIFRFPPTWTWLSRIFTNPHGRKLALKEVFKIDGASDKQIDTWRKQRNRIAHGKEGVQVLLKEYCVLSAFVQNYIMRIADECREKMKLLI